MFPTCLHFVFFYFLSVWCCQDEEQKSVPVKTIGTRRLKLGEGPHWDEITQSLYLVDILNGAIHKYDFKTGSHSDAKVSDAPVSIIIPVKDQPNKFLITLDRSIATVVWDGISKTVSDLKVLATVNEGSDRRFNDGKISPSGVLFAGTIPKKLGLKNKRNRQGNLYSFKNMKPKIVLDGISVSNGLAWTKDEKIVYYIDSGEGKVIAYDYNKETTDMTNPKTIFDFEENNMGGHPDGMTIDDAGNLWFACYNASKVLNVNPQNGKILQTVDLPAMLITSVTFGGPNFEHLYVTSSSDEDIIPISNPTAEDGYTFVVTGTGARGLPAFSFQL